LRTPDSSEQAKSLSEKDEEEGEEEAGAEIEENGFDESKKGKGAAVQAPSSAS